METKAWLDYLASAPLVLTKLVRAREEVYNLAADADRYFSGEGYGDSVEGFFARDPFWKFDALLDDAPNADTYPGTRIRTLYIKYEGECGYGCIAFKWHPMHKVEPKTAEGRRLLADFKSGIEPAIKNQAASAVDYCTVRLNDLIEQFIESGVDATSIFAALSGVSSRIP